MPAKRSTPLNVSRGRPPKKWRNVPEDQPLSIKEGLFVRELLARLHERPRVAYLAAGYEASDKPSKNSRASPADVNASQLMRKPNVAAAIRKAVAEAPVGVTKVDRPKRRRRMTTDTKPIPTSSADIRLELESLRRHQGRMADAIAAGTGTRDDLRAITSRIQNLEFELPIAIKVEEAADRKHQAEVARQRRNEFEASAADRQQTIPAAALRVHEALLSYAQAVVDLRTLMEGSEALTKLAPSASRPGLNGVVVDAAWLEKRLDAELFLAGATPRANPMHLPLDDARNTPLADAVRRWIDAVVTQVRNQFPERTEAVVE